MSTTVSPAAAAPAFPGRRPPWLEFDATDLEFLPAAAHAMIAPVIEPTWNDMVVHARGPVERAVGISMVHLVWIEILIQVGHMDMYRNQDMVLGFPLDPSAISQTLKLIAAKAKLVNACLRLEEFRLKNGRGAFEPDAGAAADSTVGRTILSVPECEAEGDGQDCPSYAGDAEEAPAVAGRKATRAERKTFAPGEQSPAPGGKRARSAQRRLRRALAKAGTAGPGKPAAVGEPERSSPLRNGGNGPPSSAAEAHAPNGPRGTQQEIAAPTVVAILERLEAMAAAAAAARGASPMGHAAPRAQIRAAQ